MPMADNVEYQTLLNYYGQTNPYPGFVTVPGNYIYPGSAPPPPPLFPYAGQPMSQENYAKLKAVFMAQLGKPYVWGAHPMPGDDAKNFDCAGFVGYCYMQAGLLPTGWWTTASLAAYLETNGHAVSLANAQPGDIVLTNNTKSGVTGYPTAGNGTNSHALIYIGYTEGTGGNYADTVDCSSSAGGVGFHYYMMSSSSWIYQRLFRGSVWRLDAWH